jgi:ribosomal protein L11 methylase PrmA
MTLPTNSTLSEPVGSSFRDPSGFVFSRDGQFFRQVNQIYRENYALLMDSGLYENLVADNLLLPHKESDTPSPLPDLAYKIIQPQRVAFISYPYEWCFSELQDAALATLEIQRRALSYGMTLKDSSAFNLQFHRCLPTLIDTLSFEKYREGEPWTAYRQFCQHFLAPLSLMAKTDIRMLQLFANNIDGLPLDLTSRLLPGRTRLSPGLLFHIHLHAASQKRYAGSPVETGRGVARTAMLGLIDSLESAVRGLKWHRTSTAWSNYYQAEHNYSQLGLEQKRQWISQCIEQITPNVVWDMGANTGMFSRIAAANGAFTLSFDIDPGAVELNYRQCKSDRTGNLLPLLTDLTNPTPAIGWENRERFSLLDRANADAVLALALIHHLAIGNNLPFDRIASLFRKLGKWLLIEFIPKGDSQVLRLLASREDIFSQYDEEHFILEFQKHFTIHRKDNIPDSDRCIFLMEGN